MKTFWKSLAAGSYDAPAAALSLLFFIGMHLIPLPFPGAINLIVVFTVLGLGFLFSLSGTFHGRGLAFYVCLICLVLITLYSLITVRIATH